MALTAKKVYAILNKKIEHGGATDEQIQNAITSYLDLHPEYIGATEEQALQILTNKRNIEYIQQELNSLIDGNEVQY